MSQVSHTFIVDSIWLKISSFFLEIMVLHMAMSYKLQVAQVNEEPASESSLALTLTQHPCDEEPKQWEVRVWLEIDYLRTWYYRISPNFRTLVILLQVHPAFGDELETVCEGYYETKNTSIFAWSSIPGVRLIVGCAV